MSQQPELNKVNILSPPGGTLVWLFIVVEFLSFSVALTFLALFKKNNLTEFYQQQAKIDLRFGLIYTIMLLTSGWLVAEFVQDFFEKKLKSKNKLLYAIILGLSFLGLKIFDYSQKISKGESLGQSIFWDYFWLLTGFHFLHVFVGVFFLTVIYIKVGRFQFEDDDFAIRGSAAFWHMCDMIWILLLPFFYFSRQLV